MAKFILAIVICWVSLLHCICAENCPPITGGDTSYTPGKTLMVWCNVANRRYQAVCKADGHWDHSKKESDCSGVTKPPVSPKPVDPMPKPMNPVPAAPAPAAPAAPAPAAPQAVISTPAVQAQQPAVIEQASPNPSRAAAKVEGCQYIPGLMRNGDADIIWKEGRQYRMRCAKDNRMSFVATCGSGAWIYEENFCKGPVPQEGPLSNLFGPMQQIGPIGPARIIPLAPGQPDGSQKQGPSLLDGLNEGLNNLLKPLTDPRPQGGNQQQGGTGPSLFDDLNKGLNNILKPLTDPRPQGGNQQQGGPGLFEQIDRAFNNLFNTDQNRNMPPGGDYKPCAYDPAYIREEDSGILFHHSYRYRVMCKGTTDRYFFGVCNNGQWFFREEDCTDPVTMNPFGNLFGNNNNNGGMQNIPWWYLLARG